MIVCQIIYEIADEIGIFYFGVFSWGGFWDWLQSYAGDESLNLRKKQSNNDRRFLVEDNPFNAYEAWKHNFTCGFITIQWDINVLR